MSDVTVILTALAIPLVGALVIALAGRNRNLRDSLMVISAVLVFLTVLSLLPSVNAGARPGVLLFEIIPGLPIAFEIEPLGMIFGLVASGLWVVTSIYGIGYMRGAQEKNQTRFFACFSIAIFAALGVAFAENMFTLFIFSCGL